MIRDWFYSGFDVKRPVRVKDGKGGITNTLTDLTSLDGLLRSLNGKQMIYNERLGIKASHKFYCDAVLNNAAVDIQPGDFIIYNSISYKVEYVKVQNDFENNPSWIVADVSEAR